MKYRTPLMMVLITFVVFFGCSPSANTPQPSQTKEELADNIASELARRVKLEESREMTGGLVRNTLISETVITDKIEAKQIDLVDGDGIPRLRLLGDHENKEIGPAIVMLTKDGDPLCYISENVAGTGLTIQNGEGTPVLQVIATKDGPVVGINDSTGANRLMLYASEEGGAVLFSGKDGKSISIDEKQLRGER